MYFDFRRVGKPHHVVLREVALLHAAFLDRDFSVQNSAQRKDDSAFHLRGDGIRIDRIPAIDHAYDPFYPERGVDDLDVGDLRDDGMKTFGQRDAAAPAFRQ